jgi:pre-mRNA-processing factor 6
MKTAVFERQQGEVQAALDTTTKAIAKYPKFAKLYMIQGQLYETQEDIPGARTTYAAGLKMCPDNATLWILASRLEERDGKSIKARAILEKARLLNPGNDVLWAEAVDVETRCGALAQAKAMLSRALQACPSSGILWSLAIWNELRPNRKAKSADALKNTKDHPLDEAIVVCTIARLFWAERKIDKARSWFQRAVADEGGRDWGEIWGWWLAFERQHGTLVS